MPSKEQQRLDNEMSAAAVAERERIKAEIREENDAKMRERKG